MSEIPEGGVPPQEIQKSLEREWREVPRPYEVAVVGDLNGSFHTFLKTIIMLGYAEVRSRNGMNFSIDQIDDSYSFSVENFLRNHDIVWTGGNKRLVFLGDIIADRKGWGGTILKSIDSLQEQAEKDGGKVIVLAGNHDIAGLIYVLTGNSFKAFIQPELLNIRELEPYRYEETIEDAYDKDYNPIAIAAKQYNVEEVLSDPSIIEMIERVQKMDLCVLIDDTFFAHANVDPEKFKLFCKEFEERLGQETGKSVITPQELFQFLNERFHKRLNDAFTIEVSADGKKSVKINPAGLKHFISYCESPLDEVHIFAGWPTVRPKYPYDEEFQKFLNKGGINLFVHGHSNVRKEDKVPFVASLSPNVGKEHLSRSKYSAARILPDTAGEKRGEVQIVEETDWKTFRTR